MRKLLVSMTSIILFFFLLVISGCVPPPVTEPTLKTPAQKLMYQGCLLGAEKGFQKHGSSFKTSNPPKVVSQICTCMVTNPEINNQMNQYLDASIAFKQNPESDRYERSWRSAKANMDLTTRTVMLQCMNSHY